MNKVAAVEDADHDVRIGVVKYVLVVDNYLPIPYARPSTPLRLLVCDLYKAQRLDFSPPGIGMWRGREGIDVIKDVDAMQTQKRKAR